jgi:hypothetical protein
VLVRQCNSGALLFRTLDLLLAERKCKATRISIKSLRNDAVIPMRGSQARGGEGAIEVA